MTADTDSDKMNAAVCFGVMCQARHKEPGKTEPERQREEM